MESKLSIDPNFVFMLSKTIGRCGRTQSGGNDLLELGQVEIGNGEAQIPVSTSENRAAIERIRQSLKMAGATDAEVLCAHANNRVQNCTGTRGTMSLKVLGAGHSIGAVANDGHVKIRITRK